MPYSLIEHSGHIVLAVHRHPDADSLGAACAFYSYLLRLSKKITLYCSSEEIDPDLAFLPWFDKLTRRFPTDAECVISFDCANFERLGLERTLPVVNFDHHASNDAFGDVNIVDTDAISTTEVVYDFFVANGIKINAKMALSLYAGLIDDSDCFKSSGCSAKTFAMAKSLVEAGADHPLCVKWLYGRRSLALIRLKGVLLSQMRLVCDGELAWFHVTREHLETTGAGIAECKLVLDEALQMHTVRSAVMVIEHPHGGVKVSIRSDGSIDAAKILGAFGGGGHRNRAGSRLKETDVEEFSETLMSMIKKEME